MKNQNPLQRGLVKIARILACSNPKQGALALRRSFGIEGLEDRTLMAFDLTIGNAATANVTVSGAGTVTFEANATGANINVADLLTQLQAGNNIAITNGAAGAEVGNITWGAGANLNYDGIANNLLLEITQDASTTTGVMALNSQIRDFVAGGERLAVTLTSNGAGNNHISISDPIVTGGSAFVADAQTAGSVFTMTDAVLAGNSSVTITAADVVKSATIQGHAGVFLRPNSPGDTIAINDATGTFSLSAAELQDINSTSGVTVGRTDGTGAINIGSLGNIDLNASNFGDLTLEGATSSVTFNLGVGSTLLIKNNADLVIATGGTVTSPGAATSDITITGTGELRLSSVGAVGTAVNPLTTSSPRLGASTVGGDMFLSEADALAITGTVNLGANDLSLTAGGAVTQSASILADGLALSGAGPFTLTNGSNNVNSLASNATGTLALSDTDGFAIATVNSINGIQMAGQTVGLTSGGTVTQTQEVLAADLSLSGAGSYTLNDPTNDVDNLASNATGTLSFTDAAGFAIATVNSIDGIQMAGQTVTLNTVAGTVTQTQEVIAANLELLGAAFTLNGDTANNIATLAGNTSGAVVYQDADGFTVGVVNTAGLTASAVALSTLTGGIVADQNVTATTGIVSITATETAAATDGITVNTGVTVSSVASSVTLSAGDDILITAGASVSSATGINLTTTGTLDPSSITINGSLAGAGARTVTGAAGAGQTLLAIDNGSGKFFNLTALDAGNVNEADNVTVFLTSFTDVDSLQGGAAADVFRLADSVANLLTGTINGQGGIDTIDYSLYTAANPVTVNLNTGVATNVMGGMASGISNIENVLGGDGDDLITGDGLANSLVGNAGNDTIDGAAGADTIEGNAGNDTLTGGEGSDSLVGGANDDTYVFGTAAAAQTDTVDEAAADGTDTLDFGALASNDPVSVNLTNGAGVATHTNRTVNSVNSGEIENALGGAGNDSLIGSAGANSLVGGLGNDTFAGLFGNDTLDGGAGSDVYFYAGAAGLGSDTIVEPGGCVDTDLLDFTGYTASGVTIDLSSVAAQAIGGGTTITLSTPDGIENVNGTGLADNITGNICNNVIQGFGGNDTIDGAAGNDTIIGTDGDDSLVGGAGDDSILGLNGNDTIDGAAGNDTLLGGEGDDSIRGGADNDVIADNQGSDIVFGDAGSNIYQFENPTQIQTDTITTTAGATDWIDFCMLGTTVPLRNFRLPAAGNGSGTQGSGASQRTFVIVNPTNVVTVVGTAGSDIVDIQNGVMNFYWDGNASVVDLVIRDDFDLLFGNCPPGMDPFGGQSISGNPGDVSSKGGIIVDGEPFGPQICNIFPGQPLSSVIQFILNLQADLLGATNLAQATELGAAVSNNNLESFHIVRFFLLKNDSFMFRFLDQTYVSLLDRNITLPEATAWMTSFKSGLLYEEAVEQILASDEFFTKAGSSSVQLIQNVFEKMLGRAATQQDIDGFLDVVGDGSNDAQRQVLTSTVLDSTEFHVNQVNRWIDLFFTAPGGPDTSDTRELAVLKLEQGGNWVEALEIILNGYCILKPTEGTFADYFQESQIPGAIVASPNNSVIGFTTDSPDFVGGAALPYESWIDSSMADFWSQLGTGADWLNFHELITIKDQEAAADGELVSHVDPEGEIEEPVIAESSHDSHHHSSDDEIELPNLDLDPLAA